MVVYSSIAWRIPWAEDTGRLLSIGSLDLSHWVRGTQGHMG